MEGTLDSRSIVLAEATYAVNRMLYVGFRYLRRPQRHTLFQKPRLRFSPQVEDDLQKLV